jgi:N,N'-diacetyllegionaminate synthase
VDLLDDLDVPAYKIVSGDLTHHPLLRDMASRGEPVVLSTGMATLDEIRVAVDVIEDAGNDDIVLLHCITRYPTDIDDANLRMMSTRMREFDYPVGLSDHTIGTTVPVAAAAMGAGVIGKHFTYDTSLEKSPDHRLSADTEVMGGIVDRTREVNAAMGRPEQGPTDVEADGMRLARRSLVTDRAIAAGERIRRADLAVKRPGTGLAPKLLFDVDDEEWRATRDLPADTVLAAADVDRSG